MVIEITGCMVKVGAKVCSYARTISGPHNISTAKINSVLPNREPSSKNLVHQ
jgi:hypothetical protein